MAKNISRNKLGVSRNKIGDRQQRRARNIKERLRDQGIGEDEAEKLALEEAMRGAGSLHGGKNAGAQPQKTTHQGGRRERTGSKSNANK